MGLNNWTPRSGYGTGGSQQSIVIHSTQNEAGQQSPPGAPPHSQPPAAGKIRAEEAILLGRELQRGPVHFERGGLTEFVSGNGSSSFSLTEEQYSMHLLLLGGIGSGKTNVFNHIITTLRSSLRTRPNDVMIIYDSKGDFWARHHQPGDVLVGNGLQYRQESCSWNIYGEIMGRLYKSYEQAQFQADRQVFLKDWETNAKELIKGLFQDRRSSTQPFFADAAASLVTKKLISVLRHGDLSEMHTYKLKEFFQSAGVQEYDALILDSRNPDFASAKTYYGDGTTPQALAVFAYVNGLVDDLFCGVFGDQSPSGREFAMRDLVRQKGGRVAFVEYDLSTGAVFQPIYQMLYDQALKEALGRSSEQGNVYLICDEFKLLGRLEHIDDGLNVGRSLGVKICAGLQSVNQIYDLYGDARGKSILSGFSNLFCFRTGDTETAKFITEHFGNQYSLISFWPEETKPVHIPREGNTVEQWDVLNLERGSAIIDLWFAKPVPPFVFPFGKY